MHVETLPDRYRPLKEVRTAFWAGDNLVTIGDTIYVKDKETWNKFREWEPIHQESSLTHERTHSIRQYKHGLFTWLLKYIFFPDFMWQEERVAYEKEMSYYDKPNKDHFLKMIDTYYNIGGKMISRERASEWIDNFIKNK